MFGKNKNKKVGLCVMVVTSCFILAGLWAVLATPETALAVKPDKPGGGGGGGGVPTCVQFDDGGSVMGDLGNEIYCHNKKEKITVEFSNALSFKGHFHLQTGSTDRANVGRGLFIDFGTPVTLSNGETIQTTDKEELADNGVLGVSANLRVGSHQDFDFLNMVEEESDSNVNLRILVLFYFTDGSQDHLWIRLDPDGPADGTGRNCLSSDPVTVTRLEDDPDTGLRMWRVVTQPVLEGACISRSSDCDDGEEGCLLDVHTGNLASGHIELNFGFTVTAAP